MGFIWGRETMGKKYLKPESVLDYSLTTSLFLLLPIFSLFLIFFIYPLTRLLAISFIEPKFTLENYIRFFEESVYVTVLLRTIRVSVIVSCICLIVGYPLAYVLSNSRGKRLARR